MEHAPLRPVPARPAGPVDPAAALREVGGWLPTLSPLAARALALVVLCERPRAWVADSLGVSEGELGELLAEARKELRQTVVVLGGSGWCERAERLISDRLDGGLADRDVRRLDVHLRNCTRCVEHERRLVQATDALVGGLGGPARSPAPAGEAPPLTEAPAPHDEAGPLDEAPPLEGEAPPLDDAPPPDGEAPPLDEAPPPDDGSEEGAAPGEETEPAGAATAAPPAPTGEQIAAAAEVLVAARTRRQIAAAVVWNAMIAIAVILTLATIALTIAGILGAKL
jgi:Putative zinc-finger